MRMRYDPMGLLIKRSSGVLPLVWEPKRLACDPFGMLRAGEPKRLEATSTFPAVINPSAKGQKMPRLTLQPPK